VRYGVGWTVDISWPSRIVLVVDLAPSAPTRLLPVAVVPSSKATVTIEGHSLEYFAILQSNGF
jgi:hypothetical protein